MRKQRERERHPQRETGGDRQYTEDLDSMHLLFETQLRHKSLILRTEMKQLSVFVIKEPEEQNQYEPGNQLI